MPKRFTLPEAERLIPHLDKCLRDAISLKSEYEKAENSLQHFVQRVMMQGGVVVDRTPIVETKTRRDRNAERLKAALENIQEIGCVVKDLDIGLVDFPTLFRGEEVYLCWKVGEPDIQFWHGVNEGFAGRKPINQEFLDNHEGDQPN